MSSSKEANNDVIKHVHEAENSDQSLSDSWTVLDSSHLNDDGDLSDAESVEVLATDGQCDGNATEEEPEGTIPLDTSNSSVSNDETGPVLQPPALPLLTQETNEAASIDGVSGGDADLLTDNEDSVPQNYNNHEDSAGFIKKLWNILWEGDRAELRIPHFILDLFWFSVLFNVLIVSYIGVSSLAGIIEGNLYLSFGGLKSLKSHQQYAYQQYEMDPLVLQLSHVVAEWKKYPLEDHSLDRHMLKTLFLYYGGSTELSASLHTMTEKVQKHNELLRRMGKELYEKEDGYHRMVVSGHLAHSVACILGKQDQRIVPPEMLFMSNTTNEKSSNFAPEPGFWLNDWHLPQYFKANDTYYRIDSKPVVSPMRNFFLNLGSAKWNEHFWRLYHDVKDYNEIDDDSTTGISAEKISYSELDGEETERSPLDGTCLGDLPSIEESSGSASESEANPEEQEKLLYPLFVSDLLTEEVADDEESKLEVLGNYFEVLDGEDYLDGASKYECLDDGCRPYKEQSFNQQDQVAKWLERGKLIRLYEEAALQETENEDQLDEILAGKFQSEGQEESFEAISSNTLRHRGVSDDSRFGKHFNGEKLRKLFDESESEENNGEAISSNTLRDRGVPDDSRFGKYFNGEKLRKLFEESQSEENNGEAISSNNLRDRRVSDDSRFRKHFNGEKLRKLFEESQSEENNGDVTIEGCGDEELDGSYDKVAVENFDLKTDFSPIESQEEKKSKTRELGKKTKINKSKQTKKEKEKYGFAKADSDNKKKRKKKSHKKEPKGEDSDVWSGMSKHEDEVLQERRSGKKRTVEEQTADWNTRMAKGREKLRALNKESDDQMWVFERAKARRDMREESYSQ